MEITKSVFSYWPPFATQVPIVGVASRHGMPPIDISCGTSFKWSARCYHNIMLDRKQYQRDYNRKWVAARRAAFFSGKSCAQCGSTQNLELDHVDPSTKIHHAIWTWRESRRLAEASKCQALCHDCHLAKTAKYFHETRIGIPKPLLRKLTDEQAQQIRQKLGAGMSERKLAIVYGVGKTTIHSIKTSKLYRP